jgi:hypothetical protein
MDHYLSFGSARGSGELDLAVAWGSFEARVFDPGPKLLRFHMAGPPLNPK